MQGEGIGIPVVIVRAAGRVCALRLADVVETLRPLRVEPLPEMPKYILGMSVVRGIPVPVLHLGLLFGITDDTRAHRWITARIGGRTLALAVEAVRGIHRLDASVMESLPTLLQSAGAVESVGTLDDQLITLLRSARLMTEDPWKQIETATKSRTAPDPAAAADAPEPPPGDDTAAAGAPRRGPGSKRSRYVPGG